MHRPKLQAIGRFAEPLCPQPMAQYNHEHNDDNDDHNDNTNDNTKH